MEKWKISENQKELVDRLFNYIELDNIKNVLDVGSGRTSIGYLTNRFKDLKITGIIYPDDQERIKKLKESVENKNYELIETDVKNFDKSKNYDIVLAHLFLGEAAKFAGNGFEEILENLFEIKTNYLVIVNLSFDDVVNYFLLLKKISQTGKIIGLSFVPSSESEVDRREKYGGGCIGMCIKFS
jgi:hypothetical protein